MDISQFDEPGFFDEAPLYSRFSQLSFLRDSSRASGGDIDQIIFDFALDYLDLLLRDCRPRSSFLAALTFVKPSEDDPIVPSIFVCNGQVEERLLGRLPLDEPRSESAKFFQGLLSHSQNFQDYEILEDTRTVESEVRVFVGTKSPSNLLMITIDEFRADLSLGRESSG